MHKIGVLFLLRIIFSWLLMHGPRQKDQQSKMVPLESDQDNFFAYNLFIPRALKFFIFVVDGFKCLVLDQSPFVSFALTIPSHSVLVSL